MEDDHLNLGSLTSGADRGFGKRGANYKTFMPSKNNISNIQRKVTDFLKVL